MQNILNPPKLEEDLLFDPEALIKSQYSSNQESLNLSLPFETDSKKCFYPPCMSPNQENHIKNSNFFTSNEGDSFDKDKLDNLLNLYSYDSYMTSEELLMNEDINFLYEKSHEQPSSCVTTSLNYSNSEPQSSVFDTIGFSNAFELSLPHAYSNSKFLSTTSFNTHNPEDTSERIDLNYEPSDRYKKKIQRINEKVEKSDKAKPAINTDGTDDLSESEKNSPEQRKSQKYSNEETVCCKSCSIF